MMSFLRTSFPSRGEFVMYVWIRRGTGHFWELTFASSIYIYCQHTTNVYSITNFRFRSTDIDVQVEINAISREFCKCPCPFAKRYSIHMVNALKLFLHETSEFYKQQVCLTNVRIKRTSF